MPVPAVETAKIAAAAQRTFGLNLLREIIDRTPGNNVFISPLSLFFALQMTGNGAAGATQAAMWKVLALPDRDVGVLNASANALDTLLKAGGKAELTIANALWASRHIPLAPDFVKLCESVFGARAASLDFGDPQAAAEINNWVSTNTNGKIHDIVTPRMVADAGAILTNAVYFAGKWRSEFPESETRGEPFYKASGDTKTVPMMHQSRLMGAYRSGGNFEGVMLSYLRSSVFLYALLPEPGKAPKDVLASLNTDDLTGAPADFDVDLKLPRFSLDFSAGLSGDLKKMGMEIAFHYPEADFEPMGSRLLFISEVIHKTRLEVDEKGTVAAAAAAVIMGVGSGMPQPRPVKTLVFDRPFVVLIGDSQTGAVLFAGAIEDP
jgi:serpin B